MSLRRCRIGCWTLREPISPEEIERAKTFCEARNFDLCYYPGMRPDEANRYTVLENPVYFESAQSILHGDRDAFYDEYLYHVRPPTDDRPYFFRFFKWKSLRFLSKAWGGNGYRSSSGDILRC